MADTDTSPAPMPLAARSALCTIKAPPPAGRPGVAITEICPAIASLTARRNSGADLRALALARFGVALPNAGHESLINGLIFSAVAPDRWFVFGEGTHHAAGRELELSLRETFGAHATVTDQSDGRTVLAIRGPAGRAALAKGVAIDLHPRAFGPGRVALTVASHINILIRQSDVAPEFQIAVFRGFAVSFAEWLIESAAEYGVSFQAAYGEQV